MPKLLRYKLILAGLAFYWLFLMHPLNAQTPAKPAPLFPDMQNVHYPAQTDSRLAQRYFNQGLLFFYGFDYLESIRSFQAATRSDPNCAMCYWGLALALGSKNNAPVTGHEIADAQAALKKAESVVKPDDKLAQGYINALQWRYAGLTDANVNVASAHHTAQALQIPPGNAVAYANAMYDLTQAFPKDDTVLTQFAFAIFDVEKWDFWTGALTPKPYTILMLQALKKALAINPNNIGAIHYYMHALENSGDFNAASQYAERLPQLAPLAEHLVHMPSHLYLHTGDYAKAVKSNEDALAAYARYVKICEEQGFKPAVNYLNQHNYDFLFSAALLAGNASVASQAAASVRAQTPVGWLIENPWMQRFYALPYFQEARFGQWQKVLEQPAPPSSQPYVYAMWLYVKGLALAHTGKLSEAQKTAAELQRFAEKAPIDNTSKLIAPAHLTIAQHILLANIAAQQQAWERAIQEWQQACYIENQIGSKDPPSWYLPCNQGLGYAFLAARRPQQAIAAFQADLALYPNNGWSLFGLSLAYAQLNNMPLQRQYLNQFKLAWKAADTLLPLRQGSDIFK